VHVAVFLSALLLLISRRPDAVLNPQLWAEEGALWYAQAHNISAWGVLFRPDSGYFCLLPRLVAGLAQLIPLAGAPLLFNLVAICFQLLPVSFLMSSRFVSLGTLHTRMLMGFFYLALPNSFDINANLTNAQWHLALVACMVILAEPARSFSWRCFDMGIMILSGLTGPFSIMLLPIAAIIWGWRRRSRWTLILLSTLVGTVLVQVGALVSTGSAARVPGSLGASPLLLAKILASQVFLAAIAGKNSIPYRHSYTLYAVLIAISGVAVLAYALWKAPWELKALVVFTSAILVASLLNPMAAPPKWPALVTAWGVRYWFLPMLAFVYCLVWMASRANPRPVRILAITVLLTMSVGIVRDWRYRAFADLDFPAYARRFSELSQGASLTIPLNPQGWSMTLIKK
jgi:hypothetical protein